MEFEASFNLGKIVWRAIALERNFVSREVSYVEVDFMEIEKSYKEQFSLVLGEKSIWKISGTLFYFKAQK